MKLIDGGVTAPEGFFATGVACGIKKDGSKDLALVCSEELAAAAGVFTTNVVKGHSLKVTMENIKSGYALAVVINSGCANACVGDQGYEDALTVTRETAALFECEPENILFGSTGVIGKKLDMEALQKGLQKAMEELDPDGGKDAAEAIMTTDKTKKEIAAEFTLQGEKVRIGGMCKGSGMIHPNMATMIGVITTDVNIKRSLLDKALKECVKHSFNRVSVDGETSVCDMVIILANGQAGNTGIVSEDKDYRVFYEALSSVCTSLSKMIVKDGEGATKLIEITVNGAASEEDAYKGIVAIAKSPLVKTAIHGEDANWGRILTAIGYSGVVFDPLKVDISIGNVVVCENGTAVDFDEDKAKKALSGREVRIHVNLNEGKYSDKIWTCDYSCEYININANYRS